MSALDINFPVKAPLIIKSRKKDAFNKYHSGYEVVVAWAIYCGEKQEALVCTTSRPDIKKLLGDLIAMWARERIGLIEWSDAKTMAGIAFYYTDLKERDIRGIFRESGRGAYPGEPPWELQHPNKKGRTLRIVKE